MMLRGFTHRSPLYVDDGPVQWPATYLDALRQQYAILTRKYAGKQHGRISLPKHISSLRAAHKYSVLARSQKRCREIGQLVADKAISFEELPSALVDLLRMQPHGARWPMPSNICGAMCRCMAITTFLDKPFRKNWRWFKRYRYNTGSNTCDIRRCWVN